MKKVRIPPCDGCYPYYAVRYRSRDFKELLATVNRSDKVYLYTGQGDWGASVSPEAFASHLAPLVKGIIDLGAKPFLLTCGCLCYKAGKTEVAGLLAIPLVARKRTADVTTSGGISLVITRDKDPDDDIVIWAPLL